MALSRKVKGGRKSFYSDPELDRLLARLARLMAEHWSVKERLLTIEALLKEQGLITEEQIDAYEPDEATEASWNAQRDQLIRSVLEAGRNVES
jgi:hypothetical protein